MSGRARRPGHPLLATHERWLALHAVEYGYSARLLMPQLRAMGCLSSISAVEKRLVRLHGIVRDTGCLPLGKSEPVGPRSARSHALDWRWAMAAMTATPPVRRYAAWSGDVADLRRNVLGDMPAVRELARRYPTLCRT